MSIDNPRKRSRWHREGLQGTVRVSKRDVEIFKLLLRYRFLRKNYLDAFLGGHPTANRYRLGQLYRAGYLSRPDQQRQYFNANYRPMIYELDEKAKAYIRKHGLTEPPMALYKNIYNEFGHLVMLCDVMANIELGAKAAGAKIIPYGEMVRFHASISDKINGKTHYSKTPVTPDALFAVEYPNGKKLHFALEVDCGTEPLKRNNLEQTSYWRKLLQYKYVLEHGTFQDYVPQLFILHVTNTPARMQHIMEMTGKSKSNLFKHLQCLGDFAPDPTPDPSFFGEWQRVEHLPFDFTK